MLTAEARIQTSQPSRYLIQLCRHAVSINHKVLRHAGRVLYDRQAGRCHGGWLRPVPAKVSRCSTGNR
jgi:hypothetical protein